MSEFPEQGVQVNGSRLHDHSLRTPFSDFRMLPQDVKGKVKVNRFYQDCLIGSLGEADNLLFLGFQSS